MAWDKDDRAKYQNDLINNRLTWLGAFEGLLFVANHYTVHPYLLPVVGLAFAISVDLGITSANRELTKLNAQAYRNWLTFLMPGTAIPKIIEFAWTVLFLENFKWFSSIWSVSRK
jgi:hypothetical protein